MPILQTHDLTRLFGELTAVRQLSISVEPQEVFGLLGPNGAGKSTVIKMLTTLLPPTSGSATVAGHDLIREASTIRRLIGYVPQMVSADGNLTGYENLLVFARLYGLAGAERERLIWECLEQMGLTDAAKKLVTSYSGGMLRRLEIAISMLHRPRLLFLDEPTVGLDPLARDTVWNHIQELRKEYGTTVFLTTHYMEEADALCDHVAIMSLGSIVIQGAPLDLKRSMDRKDATLEDVFTRYATEPVEAEGEYRETARTRSIARRLG